MLVPKEKSIGKVDDVVVFVPYAIPGDLVDIQVIKNRKRFREGKVTHYP
jgi:23S rRNA (uracil1939-C5)-methyltransferase